MDYDHFMNFSDNDSVDKCPSLQDQSTAEDVTDVFFDLKSNEQSELSSISDEDSDSPPESLPRRHIIIGHHITLHEGERPKYSCTICGRQFTNKRQLQYHDYCAKGKRPLKCNLCERRFILKSHLEYHIRTHSGESPFKCGECGKGFKQRDKLVRHEKGHRAETDPTLVCSICKKQYCNRDSLKKHFRKHNPLKILVCKVCGRKYSDQFLLKEHSAIHEGPNFICELCGKIFVRKYSLNVHMQTHNDNYPIKCTICQKTFKRNTDLKVHTIVHDESKPGHRCQFCSMICGRKDNLLRHIKNCHSPLNTNKDINSTKPPDDFTNQDDKLEIHEPEADVCESINIQPIVMTNPTSDKASKASDDTENEYNTSSKVARSDKFVTKKGDKSLILKFKRMLRKNKNKNLNDINSNLKAKKPRILVNSIFKKKISVSKKLCKSTIRVNKMLQEDTESKVSKNDTVAHLLLNNDEQIKTSNDHNDDLQPREEMLNTVQHNSKSPIIQAALILPIEFSHSQQPNDKNANHHFFTSGEGSSDILKSIEHQTKCVDAAYLSVLGSQKKPQAQKTSVIVHTSLFQEASQTLAKRTPVIKFFSSSNG